MMTPTAWVARWVMEDPQPRDFFVLDGDVLTALLLCGAALWFLIVWATASVRRFEATSMGTADAIDALPLRERSVRITSILRRAGGIARKRIRWAKALVVVLPMLGLWGAVDGLIRSFSSMAVCTVHPEAPPSSGFTPTGSTRRSSPWGSGFCSPSPPSGRSASSTICFLKSRTGSTRGFRTDSQCSDP